MRTTIKGLLFILGFVLASPLILLTWLEALVLGPKRERIFGSCTEILCIIPTIIGNLMRKAFYWATCTAVHWNTHFKMGSWLAHRDNRIAPGVVIGAFTFIGYADIGKNVLFGARVSIISGKYQHGRPEDRTSAGDVVEEDTVITVGENSWIGQDVVIMDNIGKNCTVGAGSVVMKEVADNTTVLGNPARKVNL